MTSVHNSGVEIVDVAARDGLQNVSTFVPTATKIELIRKVLAAGVKRLEIGSFVSPKHVPQMADMEDVVRGLGPLDGVRAMALVPNSKGAERALAAGVTDLIFVISMTDAHNLSNVRRPTAASIQDLSTLLAERDPDARLRVRVGIATAFHCPFEGDVGVASVMATMARIVAIRPGLELALSDTTGMALPPHVAALARAALSEFGERASFVFHGHDTAGFGVANVLAAFEAGITSFDGAVGGLGGCPFAPGATGNIATEDLVYLFERMGVSTGIDLERLLEAADLAASLPGAQGGGHVRGLPRARLLRGESACAA
ncbi:hydroxymethylglutaryl-CoA lyase [Alsobacter soli]|uniref:Hydroxymethylglutaryl-CoA lyase n=1 Tax=Alsobacter soli TaxID=2109933 RepID=A0A2T1HQ97_9HYPH|nr:hydroxymethylglutaryl-CoA lyase [Alsobacter soli]PSC03838.1 hydroxymethylglutaryl-CoA lyase [Alsobacter soli]